MPAYTTKTFADIYNAVSKRIKIPTDDTDFLCALKESINTRYNTVAFRKKWRWRRQQRTLNIPAKYTTGTVAVTNASRSLTFAGTALTSNHKDWWFNVTGTDERYKIISVDTTAQTAIMSAEYVGTTNLTAAYSLSKFQHGLVPDCEELEYVWSNYSRTPIRIVSPNEIMDLIVSNPGMEGYPEAVSVGNFTRYLGPVLGEFVLGYDFLAGEEENYLMLMTFPAIPDDDYILHYDYLVKITPLNEDTDQPLMPLEKRQILMFGALADMFSRERNTEMSQFYETKFNNELEEMEADAEYTDERPRMFVNGKWWRDTRSVSPGDGDLGSYFDRFYTPWDD